MTFIWQLDLTVVSSIHTSRCFYVIYIKKTHGKNKSKWPFLELPISCILIFKQSYESTIKVNKENS